MYSFGFEFENWRESDCFDSGVEYHRIGQCGHCPDRRWRRRGRRKTAVSAVSIQRKSKYNRIQLLKVPTDHVRWKKVSHKSQVHTGPTVQLLHAMLTYTEWNSSLCRLRKTASRRSWNDETAPRERHYFLLDSVVSRHSFAINLLYFVVWIVECSMFLL